MTKILTLVDASVLIYAAKRPTAETISRCSRALLVLGDSEREFAASEFLRMEVLPIPIYFNREREVRFYETFFESATHWADPNSLTAPAYEIACKYGIGAWMPCM